MPDLSRGKSKMGARFIKWFAGSQKNQTARNLEASLVEPVQIKVLLVVYDPIIHSKGGRKVSAVFGWHLADRLVKQFIADLSHASYGICNYEIAERIEIDAFPVKIDGFTYIDKEYVAAWRARHGFHNPDWADYNQIIADVDIIGRLNAGQIDEVWLFAFPYGGFYESRMVGPGAFWCNSPPLAGYDHAARRFIIMGFNYERGVGEMLEAFGHRAESIMAQVHRHRQDKDNLWERFTSYEKIRPGAAEVGTVHYAPNSQADYDWGNRAKVLSRCDNWYSFPDLSGPPRWVSCDEWGDGDIRLHHLWWLRHFPHGAGETGGVLNNWWAYVADPNLVR